MARINQDIEEHQPRLLIVDDDDLISDIIKDIAEELGFQVSCLSRGSQIVSELAAFQPDIIFLDLNMPELDGVEVIGILGEIKCAAKIVLMSGTGKRTIELVAIYGKKIKLDIAAPLSKPFTVSEIENLLIPVKKAKHVNVSIVRAPHSVTEFGPQLMVRPHLILEKPVNQSHIFIDAELMWKTDRGDVQPFTQMLAMSTQDKCHIGLLVFSLAEVARANEYWLERGLDVTVCIELSDQLASFSKLPTIVDEFVSNSSMNNSQFMFEVSESLLTNSENSALDTLSRMKIKGFRLSVCPSKETDSILARLNRLAIDEIVVDMSENASSEKLVGNSEFEFQISSLVAIAANSGVIASARNVSNSQQLSFAKQCFFARASGTSIQDWMHVSGLEIFKARKGLE